MVIQWFDSGELIVQSGDSIVVDMVVRSDDLIVQFGVVIR